MKKFSLGKIIGIAGGVVVILALLGFMVLWIMFPPEKIKTITTAQVGKLLGRPVKIGKAGVSAYPFIGFSLSDIEIANTDRPGYSKEAFLRFERFLLQISFTSLIKGQPEIRKIVVKKPLLSLEIDSSGAFNFDDLAIMQMGSKEKTSEKKQGIPMLPVPITLKSFVIEDGRFLFHDARSQQRLIVDDMDDMITFSIDKELRNITSSGDLSLSRVSLKTKELVKPLSNLVITLHHDVGANLPAGRMEIKALRLSLQKVFLNLTGTISDFTTTPTIDCAITSDAIALSDLLKEIPVELAPVCQQITASGDMLVGISLKGPLVEGTPLPIRGTLAIKDGMFRYAQLPKSINQINMNCAFTDNSLDITSMRLRFGENPVSLNAKIDNFQRPQIDLKVVANMNLNDIKDLAELPVGSSLGGKLNIDINANGIADPSDPSKITVQGKLDMNDVTVAWPPLEKPAVMNGNVAITSQKIDNSMSLSIGRSHMNMNANIRNYLSIILPDSTKQLPRPEIAFKITSPLIDVDEFLPPQKKTAATDTPMVEKEKGAMIAPLPGVDIRGNISAKNLYYNKIAMHDVGVTINIINDIADVAVKTGVAGGTIAENLHADIRDVHAVDFTNKLNIKSVEISDVVTSAGGFLKPTTALNRELMNLPKSLLGKINMSSDVKGRGGSGEELINTLIGDISLAMVDGTITNSLIVNKLSGSVEKIIKLENKDIRFKNLSTALHIEDKSVKVDNLKIVSEPGDWDIKGNVGFDATLKLSISNRLSKSISAQLLNMQNSGKSMVKGLLQGTQFAQAANLIDRTDIGIPSDDNGRVTLLFSLSGMSTDPKISFTGFGKGSGAQSNNQESTKKQAMKVMNEKIDQAKLEAQQRLTDERKKAETLMQQKANEQKKVVEEQKKAITEKKENAEEQLKKTAKNKLKKLF